MKSKITIACACGKECELEVYGGQYQNEYRGDCECGRKWILNEISELLQEIDDS